MNTPELPDTLPRLQQAAVESAGYRVKRWATAREVLQHRVAKDRIPGALGAFLARWLPTGPAAEVGDTFALIFDATPESIRLTGGSVAFVTDPVEQALLHLPALRSFWCNQLRQTHFEALKAIVPQAWLRDDAAVPPGAVIHGLGMAAWEQADEKAWLWRDRVLTSRRVSGAKINARYGRSDKHQVILLSR